MTQPQKPLETITRFEADRLVDRRTFNDKMGIGVGALLASSAGTFAHLWNKYVVKMGTKALDVKSLFPSAPDIDYDKAVTYLMLAIAALGVYTVADAIHDAYISRRYRKNPKEFIRERYDKKLV